MTYRLYGDTYGNFYLMHFNHGVHCQEFCGNQKHKWILKGIRQINQGLKLLLAWAE